MISHLRSAGSKSMIFALALALQGVAIFGVPEGCLAAVTFSDDFSSPVLNPNLVDVDGQYVIENGAIHQPVTIWSDRHYIRTVASDYLSTDFTFEISFTYAPAQELVFIGIGSAIPDLINGEARGLRLRLHAPPPNGWDGRLDVVYSDTWNGDDSILFPGSVGFGYLTSYGPNRVRINALSLVLSEMRLVRPRSFGDCWLGWRTRCWRGTPRTRQR
jgi:hypothetical protein